MAKLTINCKPVIPSEEIAENVRRAAARGLPFVVEKERPPLAVVGGGHSIKYSLEEVRAFPGDKWIIGSSFKWWAEQGVEGTFFSVHPTKAALNNIAGVKRALLSTTTHPLVIDALLAQGARVELFNLVQDDGTVAHGSTTATCAPILAARMGYRDVTFFGCDSNYHGSTHAYMSVADPYLMRVKCEGREFMTGAEFLMQAEFLAEMINAAPHVFKERSAGLLGALVRTKNDYDVLAISKTLNDSAEAA